jgi:hypothetical protein
MGVFFLLSGTIRDSESGLCTECFIAIRLKGLR